MWKVAVPLCSAIVVAVAMSSAVGQALHETHENAGVACTVCHQELPPVEAVPNETCVACHGTMLEPREGAAVIVPDPHRSPHLGPDEIPICSDCHSIHGESEVTCLMCHRGFTFERE